MEKLISEISSPYLFGKILEMKKQSSKSRLRQSHSDVRNKILSHNETPQRKSAKRNVSLFVFLVLSYKSGMMQTANNKRSFYVGTRRKINGREEAVSLSAREG